MEPHPKDPYAPEWPNLTKGSSDNYEDDNLPDLECAVCFSQFNNVFNTPKMLQCHHTFCLECLARMNVKSAQPETIQCPLCRAYTPLPNLGLPKLTTDATVLSYMPEDMQRVYSIRFNRDKGKLQVKRAPSTVSPYVGETRHSLDLGSPDGDDRDGSGDRSRNSSWFLRLVRTPICRAFVMTSAVLLMVSLTIGIVILLSKR